MSDQNFKTHPKFRKISKIQKISKISKNFLKNTSTYRRTLRPGPRPRTYVRMYECPPEADIVSIQIFRRKIWYRDRRIAEGGNRRPKAGAVSPKVEMLGGLGGRSPPRKKTMFNIVWVCRMTTSSVGAASYRRRIGVLRKRFLGDFRRKLSKR